MTDAYLMDAECVHGEVWYECAECDEDVEQILAEWREDAIVDGGDFP